MSTIHEQLMSDALMLAKRGTGHVSPNPRVGCVLVKDKVIIGRGWHQKFGEAHAEVNALNDAGDAASGATAYVTLEPCAHVGKTAPCADALIKAGIAHVVIAANDQNPTASGGIEKLERAGISVTTGVLEAEADFLNRMFNHHMVKHRPWVIGKTATSLDGRIATRNGHSQWITGPAARRRSHDLRQTVDAIVVGAETLRRDDPALTVRDRWDPELSALDPAHPQRIIVTRSGNLPSNFQAINGTLPGKSLVATTDQMPKNVEKTLNEAGTEVLRLPSNPAGQIHIDALLEALAPSCQSLMVEGGSQLLGAFVDANAVDEIWAFVAPKIIGGASAPSSVNGLGVDSLDHCLTLTDVRYEPLDPDLLIRGLVDRNPKKR